jgi:RNA-directed DNA polymerase
MSMEKQERTFAVSRREVYAGWLKVKSKGGKGGVDGESIKSYESNLKKNLYKVWNRMSSGSYHPKAVLRVEIPKSDGGKRELGIPTIEDRVAQEVVRARLEEVLEPIFHEDSYGYRKGRNACQAVGKCRGRCWKYDWVIDLDIQKFFDTIDHELMMKAVRFHCEEKWMLLYIERWLKAPVSQLDGSIEDPKRGTPQGGVISPLLANLYLHYTFDMWMKRKYPEVEFERYADDAIIHCRSEDEAQEIKKELEARLKECQLELHPKKTKVVYCRDGGRKRSYPEQRFKFLGYVYEARSAKNRSTGERFLRFLPAVSQEAGKNLRTMLKEKVFRRTHISLEEIVKLINPVVRGFYNYFSQYYASKLYQISSWLDYRILKWWKKKAKRNWKEANSFLLRLRKNTPQLFAHWNFRFPGRAV